MRDSKETSNPKAYVGIFAAAGAFRIEKFRSLLSLFCFHNYWVAGDGVFIVIMDDQPFRPSKIMDVLEDGGLIVKDFDMAVTTLSDKPRILR